MSTEADSPKLAYRLLTGVDDHDFCVRVAAALEDGYKLHGSPGITRDAGVNHVCQAVVLS